jgi:type I restriction enzyme S subunit
LHPEFLKYFLSSPAFRNWISSAASSVTGSHARAKAGQILEQFVPVPSIDEQDEILWLLDELFSRLDAAAAVIATVRTKADRFRRSLLHAAFTGALTHTGARRMSDNQSLELPEAWVERSIGEVASFGRKPSTTLLEGNVEVSFVPMTCVEEESGRIELGQVISATEGKRRSLTYFEDGDVLFAKITPCMENGKFVVAKGLQNGAAFGSSEFYVLKPKEDTVLPEFLNFVLVDPSFRSKAARAMTGAVGQQRVPRRFIEAFNLDIPPLPEQREIVRILEEQFFRLEGSLAVADEVEQKVGALRQSLLHAAFSGELTKEWRERDRG